MFPSVVKGKLSSVSSSSFLKRDIVFQGENTLNFEKIRKKRSTSSNLNAGHSKKACPSVGSIKTTPSNTQDDIEESSKEIHNEESLQDLQIDLNLSEIDLYNWNLHHYNSIIYSTAENLFVILDWDELKRELKKSNPVIVIPTELGYLCTCNKYMFDYGTKVSNCTAEDLRRLFHVCMHIRVIEKNHNYEISSQQNVTSSCDHNYDSVVRKEWCVLPLDWILQETYLFIDYSKDVVSYSVIQISHNGIKCISCLKNCGHRKSLEELVSKLDVNDDYHYFLFEISEKLKNPKILKSKSFTPRCYSFKKVLFTVSETQNISDDPGNIFECVESCLKVKSKLTNCPECNGLLHYEPYEMKSCIYTRYHTYPSQVFKSVCTKCLKVTDYDGGEDLLLNMGRVLIHHSVLRDYLYQFLYSRSTIISFYNIWNQHQEDNGNNDFKKSLSYLTFRHSWYEFVNLLDINYSEGFLCNNPSCGTEPEVLIFDGTFLSYPRTGLKEEFTYDDSEVLNIGRYSDRVFFRNTKLRADFRAFVKNGLSVDEFSLLLKDLECHQPCLVGILQTFESKGSKIFCPDIFKEFLEMLSCNSPVCATFPFQELEYLQKIIDMDVNAEFSTDLLRHLQIEIPILFNLCSKLISLPAYLKPVINEIYNRSILPFKGGRSFEKFVDQEDVHTNTHCYPGLQPIRKRGKYKIDQTKATRVCIKKGTKHPTLLPGIFSAYCPHGVCYGFEVMVSTESPNIPFTFLKSWLKKPPSYVIYDNACNLFEYCLNRDPFYFRNTRFFVDGLHWPNHRKCSKGYMALNYPKCHDINTQIVEQSNSKIRKLKSSLSYMSQEHFIQSLRLFLWHSNKSLQNP